MAVSIRLRRAGAKKNAFYHVVATNSRNPRDGKFIEKLGFYDPRTSPPAFEINRERLNHWLGVGAKSSRTVSQLVARFDKQAAVSQGS